MTSSEPPLPVYIHIHKNGGTSIREWLQAQVPSGRLVDTLIPRRWGADNLPRTVHSRDHVVQGEIADIRLRQHDLGCLAVNLPWGVHELIGRRCEYFAVLRPPLDRVCSLWSAAYRNRQHSRLWQSWERLDLDLHRILARPCGTALRDDQVRMISGSGEHEVTERHVDAALANLAATFSEVGVFEDLSGFTTRVGLRYGWSQDGLSHRNRGDQQGIDLLTAADLELLAAANRHDALLYEAVVSRSSAAAGT
jgi:hypothetical protein